eukprot:TRINITY_DN66831_c0_g1_i1.p2 TRINITY_DN66831_c0_g1~~TRINITY_DN66831_c0_g1_i1.p2  ORF type:complete len:105 (-),score=73.16 TRINITY_DN66831_c0_g1_i1:63-377(-)
MVAAELALLGEEDADNVFKQVGPVLVKQDLDEAKVNVNKRIEFIKAKLKEIDEQKSALEKEQQGVIERVQGLQAFFNKQQQAAVARAAAQQPTKNMTPNQLHSQ